MSSIQLRTEIGKLLTVADERLLSSVYALMRSYLEHDETVVGYTTEGKPITGAELLTLVEVSRQEALQGKTLGVQDILSKIETW